MQTFDRLKIVADITAIRITDERVFTKSIREDTVISMKYYQSTPCMLMVKVDYENGEVVVEFTGKILGHKYPQLISITNIEDCFQGIESLGFCTFDMDMIMDSTVVSCDVTKDIQSDDVRKIQVYIKSHILNYDKYVCRALKNGNVVLEKNVTTRRIRKRLTIYDKGKEMNKADNVKFMKTNGLSNEYDGKCRFEMNLTTQEQIRNTLHIEDTKLKSVLSSTNNPIVDFLNEAVGQTKETIACSEWKSYQRYLVLKDCDFDLAKVEAKVRSLYKRGTKIADVMKPYRDAYDSLCFVKDDFFSGLIRQLN